MFKTRTNYNRKGFAVGEFPSTRPVFSLTMKNGKKVLEKTGENNFYRAIQDAVPDTCLINIINRLTKGDDKAVGDVVGGFVDITQMPKNLMEAQNLMMFSEQYFNGLPKEVREKYKNNLGGFLQDIDKELLARQTAQFPPAPVQNEVVKDGE